MLIYVNALFVCALLTHADSPPETASPGPTIHLKNAPTYRDSVPQAIDPNRPADPSLKTYSKDSASYRVNAPAPSNTDQRIPPPPQHRVLDNEFRVPNNTEGVVQNITVVVPPNSHLPAKHFYDQLAQGKTPLLNKKRAINCCVPGFTPIYNPRGVVLYEPPAIAANPYPLSVVNPGFVGPIAPQPILPPPEPIPLIIDVEWLDRALMNRRRVRLLDATPSQQRYSIDYRQFRDEYYAKFDRLLNERPNVDFQRLHIPTAVHFNFDIATYPAWNDPSALYPPELFQQYIRKLGINQDDHIIVYSRGTLGGMLSASRVWNLFRIYGHSKISILDGGFEAWRSANLTLTDLGEQIIPGNWTASFDPTLVIAYEDLTIPGSDGFCVLNRLSYYNFLDARPKPDYYGLYPLIQNGNGPPNNNQQPPPNQQQNGQNGNGPPNGQPIPPPPAPIPRRPHVPGAKSLPAEDLVRPDGYMLPVVEIKTRLQQAGYQAGRESIAAGNNAEEASMVVLALALAQDPKVRLYNAGIPEMRLRTPQLINAK